MNKEDFQLKKEQEMDKEQETKELKRVGCLPGQTLEQIRQELRERSPGITDEELEALGC